MIYVTFLALLLPSVGQADDNFNCITSALIKVESSGNANAVNTTPRGVSHGVMQIQLSTAQDMGFKGKLKDLYKPVINKIYGTKYIQWLLKWHHGDLFAALDSYNRGIDKVAKFPYKGDWKQHKYVGKILEQMETLCPTYYAQILPTK